MTLKVRFAAAFILYTVMVVGLFAGAYYVFEKRGIVEAQRKEQERTEEKIASVCRAVSLGTSATVAINYFEVLKNDSGILFAACLDARGVVQAHSDPSFIGEKLPPDLSPFEKRISVRGGELGAARVAYDPRALEREISDRLWTALRRLSIVASGTFLLALLGGLALAWSLSRPIGQLAEGVRTIGGGRLEFDSPLANRKDELGYLAKEVGLMARRLKELDQLKDQFVATVSHDLRSPMSAIMMHVNFLLNQEDERSQILPRHQEMLSSILESAAKLSVYVTNILDVAKMRAGRMEYRLMAVDVGTSIHNVCRLFEIVADNRKIALTAEVPDGLPPARADPERLDQALTNLLSNALKFTPLGGRVAISAAVVGGKVELCVQDTGKGISAEKIPHLFKCFGQVDTLAQKTEGIRGTGLGLYIVKQTAQAMGGDVRVESSPKKGSRFTLSLPLAQ